MPNLPTISVTQAQADRILAVFGDVTAYKEWLLQSLIGYVQQSELSKLRETQQQDFDKKRAEVRSSLPDTVS